MLQTLYQKSGGGRGTLLTVISSVRAPLSLAHLGACRQHQLIHPFCRLVWLVHAAPSLVMQISTLAIFKKTHKYIPPVMLETPKYPTPQGSTHQLATPVVDGSRPSSDTPHCQSLILCYGSKPKVRSGAL